MSRPVLPGGRRTEFAVVLSLVAFVGGSAAVSVLAGGEEVWGRVGTLDGALLATLLALSLANYALRALRWHLYARHLRLPVSLTESALTYVAGFSLTTTPGRVGEALRLWLMERMGGIGYARTLPLLLADRLSDLGAVGLLLVVGIAGVSADPRLTAVAVAAVAVSGLLVLCPGTAPAAVTAAHRLVGRRPRLFARLRAAARRTAALFTPRLALVSLGLAMLGWAAEGLAFHLLLTALGWDVGFLAALMIFTAGMLVGALTIVPGGLGGTEGTMLALLALQGVPLAPALTATLVIRVTTLWFAVALGFAVLPPTLRLARQELR